MAVLAIPKPESYVLEWEAVRVGGAEDFSAVRRLIKNTPWAVQMVLEKGAEPNTTLTVFLFTTMHPTGMEQWSCVPGDWIIKSPHGRFWFMPESEFESQFTWKA